LYRATRDCETSVIDSLAASWSIWSWQRNHVNAETNLSNRI